MLGNETTNKKRADLIGFSARDSGGAGDDVVYREIKGRERQETCMRSHIERCCRGALLSI